MKFIIINAIKKASKKNIFASFFVCENKITNANDLKK